MSLEVEYLGHNECTFSSFLDLDELLSEVAQQLYPHKWYMKKFQDVWVFFVSFWPAFNNKQVL